MKNLKNVLIGFLLMGSVGYASAQNWAGSYIGLHVGSSDLSLKHSDTSATATLADEFKKDASKTMGGLYFGHNFQWGNIVAGPELEFSLGKVNFDNTGWQPSPALTDLGADCSWCSYEITNSARLRLKAGYVYENSTLLFVTGGLAMAKFQYSDMQAADFGGFKGNVNGVTYGVGFEHMLNKNFGFRAEYLRDQYSSKDFVVPGIEPFDSRIKLSADTFRVGLSYKF